MTRKNRDRSSAKRADAKAVAKAAGDAVKADARADAAVVKAEARAHAEVVKAEAKHAADAVKADAKAATEAASRTSRVGKTVRRAVVKADEALAASATEQERLAERAEHKARQLDRLAGYLGALDVWMRAEPGERRPRFTRDEIAAAAIRIADTEGIEALSMRHLAAELGAGTMTLYHYVRTKDELMTLVNDAILGEVVVPPDQEIPTDWRSALTLIAVRSRDALRRHPWVLEVTDDPAFGPNGVRHFDQSLAAVASIDAPLRDRLDIVACVDEYVFGHCLNERNNDDGSGALFSDDMKRYVETLIDTGDYPEIADLAHDLGLEGTWEEIASHQRDAGRFERNLRRLLDGIEAGLDRTTGRA